MFGLDKKDDNGVSVRAHLEQVMESTGRAPDELVPPPFPDVARHVWENFIDIHRGRRISGMGASGIAYSDIQDWCNLRNIRLSSWEIDVVLMLSGVWVKVMNEDSNV